MRAGGDFAPRPGIWFVKPIINLNGMGVGAYVKHYDGGASFPVYPGSFWMPHFTGRHLSIDLQRTPSGWDFGLTVECIYRNNRPFEWRRMTEILELPEIFTTVETAVPCVNIELIGGHVIEVHLRRNHDFDAMPKASSVFPVWDGETVPADMVPNQEDADGFLLPMRLGFVYRQKTIEPASEATRASECILGAPIKMDDRRPDVGEHEERNPLISLGILS